MLTLKPSPTMSMSTTAEDRKPEIRHSACQRCRKGIQVRGAGETIEQAEAIQHDGRRQGTIQEVLEASLRGTIIGQHEARQDVERDGSGLDRQVQHDQIRGATP